MNLELGIKKQLLYLFGALIAFLLAVLFYSNYEVRKSERKETAQSLHNVFERVLSESVKTNDVPEISRLLKRAMTDQTLLFIYEPSSKQIILPNYFELRSIENLVKASGKCTGDLTQVRFSHENYDLFCRQLTTDSGTHIFNLYQMMKAEPLAPVRLLCFGALALVGFLLSLWFSLSRIMREQLFEPIESFETYIAERLAHNSEAKVIARLPAEIVRLRATFDDLFRKTQIAFELEKKVVESETGVRIAKQVAHDIRSPISALNMVFSNADELREDKRALASKAIQRINDIANDLLRSTKHANAIVPQQETLIEIELESLISEKRAEFARRLGVEIGFKINGYPSGFSNINPFELKRVLSNLINNAVEALKESRGNVQLSLGLSETELDIVITDDGVGIPEEVLPSLGKPGFSFGKSGDSGSGLGVSSAAEFANANGGRIEFESQKNQGTSVHLKLPRLKTPAWYVEKLRVLPGTTIAILDDDASIHQLWKNQLSKKKLISAQIKLVSFSSTIEFKTWACTAPSRSVFLIDYEVLGSHQNGIEVVEELGIASRAILVSSHFEDERIKSRCRSIGLRQIPKTSVGLLPIDLVLLPRERHRSKAEDLVDDGLSLA